ncbi:pyruvate formate lyase family protein [Streptomyces sp. NPDC005728]|uniref:pyruvate formate lyase family protein n=1 Tax=Streptomyces sp. NPDC005728 TaxID=3157054 RepID=UPI0034052CD8
MPGQVLAGVQWLRSDHLMLKVRVRTATPAEIITATAAEDTTGEPPARWDAWAGFRDGCCRDTVDVRDFVQRNCTPHGGDASFLAGPAERTTRVWNGLLATFPEEIERGFHDVDLTTPSRTDAFAPGYVDPDPDLIVRMQTDAPPGRDVMPGGGRRMVDGTPKAYGYEPDPGVRETYTKTRKTYNDGVFDAFTPEIRACRSCGIITGLPDAYVRGRIIGGYRRVALYGVDRLIAAEQAVKVLLDAEWPTAQLIQEREEVSEQIRALEELRPVALSYGYEISGPACPGRKAVQWLSFACLGAVEEQNGAAMSIGRCNPCCPGPGRVRGPGPVRGLNPCPAAARAGSRTRLPRQFCGAVRVGDVPLRHEHRPRIRAA